MWGVRSEYQCKMGYGVGWKHATELKLDERRSAMLVGVLVIRIRMIKQPVHASNLRSNRWLLEKTVCT
jgi:hypothetical protein